MQQQKETREEFCTDVVVSIETVRRDDQARADGYVPLDDASRWFSQQKLRLPSILTTEGEQGALAHESAFLQVLRMYSKKHDVFVHVHAEPLEPLEICRVFVCKTDASSLLWDAHRIMPTEEDEYECVAVFSYQ